MPKPSHIPAALALLAATACVPSGHMAYERAVDPTFDAIAFFAGPTQGEGVLRIAMHHPQTVRVEGRGMVQADGGIVLEQDVRRGDAAPTHRVWHLHRDAPGRYVGTLSDAIGPVRGETSGNRLHLAFALKGGLRVQQWLYLRPGGQIARNRMIVAKFGVPVASLDETITRQAP